MGFPTELALSLELQRQKWGVYNSPLFEDPDTGKSREIDIHAYDVDFSLSSKAKKKMQKGDENKMISHLVIEVKKSEKPWVFFDNGTPYFWPQIPMQNFKSSFEDFDSFVIFDSKVGFNLKSHRYMASKLYKSFHTVFTKPSEPSQIYEALIKVSKAITFIKQHYAAGGLVVHLFTPVIVLDGSLWGASLDKNDKVSIKKANFIPVVFSQLLKNARLNMSFEEDQICDVVLKKYFP